MNQHEREERPKVGGERQAEHRQATHQLAESQEFFRREIAVRVLVAKKHRHHRRQRESVENGRFLQGAKIKAGQIAENQRQPGAPDDELQNHHDEELGTDAFIHAAGA